MIRRSAITGKRFMKIIFCPTMFTDIEEDMKKSLHPNSVSGHKYQENLLRGMVDAHGSVTVLNVPRIRRYPDYPKIVVKERAFAWHGQSLGENIGFLNLWGINYLTQAVSLYKRLKAELEKDKDGGYALVVFNTHLPQTLAFMRLKKRYPNVILCDAIGDLHGRYGIPGGRGMKGRLLDALGRWQDRLAEQFDTYVLLSKYMAEVLGIQGKPYVVVEGFAPLSSDMARERTAGETGTKVIFYAGAVQEEYGLEHLLRAFSMIEGSGYRLVIAGAGNAEKMVKGYAGRDPRIRYLGVITPNEVAQRQAGAAVLVSPRLPNYDFVKASFPSKTMECLASGVPYVAHRLPCDPPEYAEYIQYADGESDGALRDKLVEICELPQEVRDEIGRKSREFILREKDPKVQCGKIVGMWEGLITKEGLHTDGT